MEQPRARFQAPPLWARWALAILVAGAIVAGIVIAAGRAGPEGAASSEAGAEAEVNRIADIAIAEDEAPRFAGLASGATPARALEQAIAGNVRERISHQQITGPLQSVHCTAAGAARDGRKPYRCTVRSAGISYPFRAVVDERARRLAWCKVDPPPNGSGGQEIPISADCRV
jgi:hypothetical protein